MKTIALLFLGLLVSSSSLVQARECPQHYANGSTPEIVSPKLASKTTSLCFEAFAVMHSGISRTPLWSAEFLDADRISDAKSIKRRDAFEAEERIRPSERAELRDYARSGFDRGHMSPAGDMPTSSAKEESFSLANIVPQNPDNNQNLWASIEERTRSLARDRGKLYVITGPIFEGASVQRLNGRVLVPTHVFKAVYDPVRKEAAAWVAENEPGPAYEVVTIAELEKRIQINLFPGMPDGIKRARMKLPEPKQPRKRRSEQPMPTWLDRILQ
ncbi:DNA/RNA non-specific endonuclease [Noviherbaspirillum cavernae]|nr:DNA/RNA non-specific endonuclease [Noviherbaspirillum cavernae]